MSWVYILEMGNGKYYVGSTSNLIDRLERHFGGREKTTMRFGPVKLVYFQKISTKSEAIKLEYKIKKMKSHKYIDKLISDTYGRASR